MQFPLIEKYHRLLIEGVEWQASSVMHHARRWEVLAPYVRIVDRIKEATPQSNGFLLTEIADEDLEIAAFSMESYYAHGKDTFFVDDEGCNNLIEMLHHAEDICLLCSGRKPPERSTRPVRTTERVAC